MFSPKGTPPTTPEAVHHRHSTWYGKTARLQSRQPWLWLSGEKRYSSPPILTRPSGTMQLIFCA